MLINSFPSEREIVLRERAAGSYKVSAYFMSKILAEGVIQVVYPIIFSLIVYWIIDFHHKSSQFFVFALFMILCNLAATSLALMISAICRTTNLSVNILPIALEIARLFGGFFLAPANLPKYFVWLDVLSYLKYTYVGISLNELTGLKLHCLDSELVNGKCPITSGEQTIEKLGFDAYTIGGCIGALILYIFLARTIAFIALKKIKW
jgi:ATP-binding cassette subfamily G (WHITE) protein 2